MRFIGFAAQAPASGDAAANRWRAGASQKPCQTNMAGLYSGRFVKLAIHATVRPEGLPGGMT